MRQRVRVDNLTICYRKTHNDRGWWKTRGLGPGLWKVWGLVENTGYQFFRQYEFSSVKGEVKLLLAYIAMNINSASQPETRCSIKKANYTFREKENHSRAHRTAGSQHRIFHLPK